uniref:Uncharacterized protein n=1 Tax=viral metagenome TaxID=1070528 RepID=A0A6M3KQS6_9ZZZZ
MKTNIWLKKNIVIFIGGDPEKNKPPIITLELTNPQIVFDADSDKIIITETK